MGFLEKLDLAILDGVFQKIVDGLGISGFVLARYALLTSVAATFVRAMIEQNTFNLYLLVPLFVAAFIMLQQFEREDKLVTSRVMNVRRLFVPWGILRLLIFSITLLYTPDFIMLLVLDKNVSAFLLKSIDSISLLAAFYFSGCSSKPPKPLKAGNKLALAPAPTC